MAEHKGQVAFVGGAVNAVDRTRSDTALSEAGEEIGLRSDDVTVLGCVARHPGGGYNSSSLSVSR